MKAARVYLEVGGSEGYKDESCSGQLEVTPRLLSIQSSRSLQCPTFALSIKTTQYITWLDTCHK